MRCRCVENLATAKASLHSLAELLDKIGNIVINDDIGHEVTVFLFPNPHPHPSINTCALTSLPKYPYTDTL